MQPLLSERGCQALQQVVRSDPLLAFDFDGTLSPIVALPGQARVEPESAVLLDRLARLRPVAVVTGRSVRDVKQRLGFEPQYVVGNHGAEDPQSKASFDLSPLDDLRRLLAQHRQRLQQAGVLVEDKTYSFALHYREAPNRRRAFDAIGDFLDGLDARFENYGGKSVVNIVLVGAPDKGDAVQSLVERARCRSALFVGDDLNDEAVFKKAAPDWVTVRVGRDFALSRAAFFLDDFSRVQTLLETLLNLLQTR